MLSFTSIITAIKGASLATQISIGVGVAAVVVGGTVGTVAIISNTNNTPQTQQIASDNSVDDNSPSEPTNTQLDNAGQPQDNKNKAEQTANEQKPSINVNNNSQTTQKPSTEKPATNNQNQPSNNSSASKPNTSTTQLSQPSQPTQPAQPTKKPDYNLNDRYIAGYYEYPLYHYDPNGPDLQQCTQVGTKSIFGLAKFETGMDLFGITYQRYYNFVKANGYSVECGGIGAGAGDTTWGDMVSLGIALDEAKCAQYGLSCGRW